MTETATGGGGLQRAYRRLLGLYTRDFRERHEGEMVDMLMAAAAPGQRRPDPRDALDIVKGSFLVRLREARTRGHERWRDALAAFTVLGPVLLVATEVLQFAIPYRGPTVPLIPAIDMSPQERIVHARLGASQIPGSHGFLIILGASLVVAVLALLGTRRLTLGALVALMMAAFAYSRLDGGAMPDAERIPMLAVFLLVAVALAASPGPRVGRRPVRWQHWVILVLVAGTVDLWALGYRAAEVGMEFPATWIHGGDVSGHVYYSWSVALGALALVAALIFRVGGPLIALLAAALCPLLWQTAVGASPALFTYLAVDGSFVAYRVVSQAGGYLPALLVAAWAAARVVLPRRRLRDRAVVTPDEPTGVLSAIKWPASCAYVR
jgi:hypothetical protein